MTAPHRVGKYDVFISHCGDDCKRDFADLLRDDLERAGVSCFLDEPSLEVGKVAADEMLKAMEEATYGVVILSPGFFEREWCMKELETFARRGRIVPVFLGDFAAIQAAAEAAVAKGAWRGFGHFEWSEEGYQMLVRENTKFVGVRLAEKGWWRTCIRRVRDEVLRLLGKVGGGIRISEDELLVGQEEHLTELKRLLGLPQKGEVGTGGSQAAGEVGIVGVKGMGGVGKTTLAKKLYDEADVREWFKGNISWLEVGPKPSDDKIANLQRQILRELGDSSDEPWNPTRGRELIRQRLNGKRLLICLDDVWETVSIETAVVNAGDLALGSRILKTSRKRESIGGHVHDLDSLKPGPAWELFCWHAFGEEKPAEGLAEMAKRAAARCGGLPLALRVLGRQVAEAVDKKGCITELLKLPRHDDAMKACHSVIRTSYDNLPTDSPGLGDVFILVAGVWPRTPDFMQRQRAIENLGAAVYGGESRSTSFRLAEKALDKLNSLSLIGLKEDGNARGLSLTVHDLIVDVAEALADRRGQGCEKFFRQRADAEGLELPRDSSRLEHLSIHSGSLSTEEVPAACSLVLGPGAQLLGTRSLPGTLRLLDAEGLRSVQLHELRNLRSLRLHRCLFDLFPEGMENLRYLCILNVTHCLTLTSFSESVGRLSGLTSLDLLGCLGLRSLPETVGALGGLTSLDLKSCRALARLPESVGRLTKLTCLDLHDCEALESLPESVGALTGLTRLDLSWCRALRSIPESVGRLAGLTSLELSLCEALRSLPESVGALTRLTRLDLSWCKALKSLPGTIGRLTGLTSLDLSLCKELLSLPESVEMLTGLTRLDLSYCGSLQSLPESVGALTGLTSLSLFKCGALHCVPESIRRLTGLTSLNLSGCEALRSLPESVRALMEQGEPLMQSNAGLMYEHGTFAEDEARAAKIYAKAAEQGDATGQRYLGMCYAHGKGVEKDEARAAKLYAKAADQGNAQAQFNLGLCYQFGRGVEKDEARAAELYHKAAEQGDASGQCNLGWCYANGRGVEKDEERAAELYAKAADQGYAAAQCNLGFCYQLGMGVEKDEAKAVELFRKAAEQGYAMAQCNLGFCYQLGRGVEKDATLAAELYEKAADQGVSAAQGNLGELYAEGLGVQQDWAVAFRLFESAAKDAEALSSRVFLVWLLWHGEGTEQDRPRAERLCAQVLRTERYAERLANDYIAAGEVWPAVLKWFRSEAWRADESSGEAVDLGEGESGSLQEREENGRATFAHVREGASSGLCEPGDEARESRGELGTGHSSNPATLRRFSALAVTIAVVITVAVNKARPPSSRS
jgi:TPR repeat protein/Leucine-rich repeat (LRR) protein